MLIHNGFPYLPALHYCLDTTDIQNIDRINLGILESRASASNLSIHVFEQAIVFLDGQKIDYFGPLWIGTIFQKKSNFPILAKALLESLLNQ